MTQMLSFESRRKTRMLVGLVFLPFALGALFFLWGSLRAASVGSPRDGGGQAQLFRRTGGAVAFALVLVVQGIATILAGIRL